MIIIRGMKEGSEQTCAKPETVLLVTKTSGLGEIEIIYQK